MYPCVLDACYLVVFFVCKQQLAYEWFIFDKQKTAYELRISDWSSDVCSSDLVLEAEPADVHDVAGLGPSAGEGLVDAECLEPAVGLVERFDLRAVRQSDGALGLAAEDRVAAVVLALDPVALGAGATHHEGLRHRKSVVEGKSGSVRLDPVGSR